MAESTLPQSALRPRAVPEIVVDRIWRFFCSVRAAIVEIAFLAAAGADWHPARQFGSAHHCRRRPGPDAARRPLVRVGGLSVAPLHRRADVLPSPSPCAP